MTAYGPVDLSRDGVTYDAFISYSHALDGKLAPTLQTLVEHFAKPWYRPRALRVFRDDASLTANPDLWSSIETALAGSSWLVLLASPEAAGSVYVDREVAWWLEHKSADRLLVALTGGQPAVRGQEGAPEDAGLPPAMAAAWTTEPRWVDLRWLRETSQVDGSNPRLRECVADIAAAVRGIPKDLLVGEHIRQHRKAVRLARAAAAGLALLTVIALVATFVALGQRDNAVFNQILARAEQLQTVDVSLAAQLTALAYEKEQTPEAYTALVTRGNQARSTVLAGHGRPVRAVTVDPAGRWIASGGEDSTVRLWDPGSGSTTAVLELGGEGTTANAFAVGAGGRLLLAGLSDGTVRGWDVGDVSAPRPVGEPLRAPGAEPVTAVALSPDGRTLATGNAGNQLRLWDVSDPARPRLGDAVVPGYRGVAFSADGRLLAAGDLATDSVGLFDTADPLRPVALGRAVIGKEGHNVNTVAFGADGRTLVSGGTDTYTQYWDIADPRAPVIIGSLASAGNSVNSVAVSADGTTLAIGSADSLIQIANIADPRSPLVLDADGRLSIPGTFVLQIALTPDGRRLVSGHSDGTVRLWDLPVHYLGSTNQVQSVQFSPDGSTLAAAGHDGAVRLWPVDRPEAPVVLRGHTDTVWNARFSPDGTVLATASRDGTVRLWDPRDPGALPRTVLAGEEVQDVAFSPDGRRLATAGAAVKLWDLAEPGRPPTTFGDGSSTARSIAFAPAGSTLAVGYDNGWIDLYDTARPDAPRRELDGHTQPVTEVTFRPDGRYVASAAADQTVRLWDVGDPAVSAPPGQVLNGHTNTVYGLSFSPDGTRLASAGMDQSVRLWNLDDPAAPVALGQALPLGLGPGMGVAATSVLTAVDYAPDGRRLAITGADRTVRVWDLDPATLVARICRTAGGNLTERAWQQYFRDQTFEQPSCA